MDLSKNEIKGYKIFAGNKPRANHNNNFLPSTYILGIFSSEMR